MDMWNVPTVFIGLSLITPCFCVEGCASSQKSSPSPTDAAFLAWAQERGYTDFQSWPRRGSPGICWALCQCCPSEVWYKIGACPGEWFSLVRVAPNGNTWRVEEFQYRPGDIEDSGLSPEGIAACLRG